MTTTLCIRISAGKKRYLQKVARPNVSAWLNALIDRELNDNGVDWMAHFKELKRTGRLVPNHPDDEVRRANR